jgi:hypothetical protein
MKQDPRTSTGRYPPPSDIRSQGAPWPGRLRCGRRDVGGSHDCSGERSARRSAPGLGARPVEPPGPPRSARLLRTTHWPGQPLGSAEITHPFHPLRGHQFVVLKIRKVSGVETLSLRHAERGSFGVPREWTDWAPPGSPSEPINGQQPLLFDAVGALALSELVCSLRHKK